MKFPALSVIRVQYVESKYCIAGDTVPVSAEIQALLDTPTTPWENISETGLDKLSDIHLSATTDQPNLTTDSTVMQVDLNYHRPYSDDNMDNTTDSNFDTSDHRSRQ